MGVRQIETVDDLRALHDGARVDVKQDPPSVWVIKGDRLVKVDDESIVLSANLFQSAISAKQVTARVQSAPFEGDAAELVAALRDMAYENKEVRDLLIAHKAAELETCKVEVSIAGWIDVVPEKLADPFTTTMVTNGRINWSRVVTIVREEVMGCQCDTVTNDEVREFVPEGNSAFEFTKKCNLH